MNVCFRYCFVSVKMKFARIFAQEFYTKECLLSTPIKP